MSRSAGLRLFLGVPVGRFGGRASCQFFLWWGAGRLVGALGFCFLCFVGRFFRGCLRLWVSFRSVGFRWASACPRGVGLSPDFLCVSSALLSSAFPDLFVSPCLPLFSPALALACSVRFRLRFAFFSFLRSPCGVWVLSRCRVAGLRLGWVQVALVVVPGRGFVSPFLVVLCPSLPL